MWSLSFNLYSVCGVVLVHSFLYTVYYFCTIHSHFQKQKEDPSVSWRLPDDFTVAYAQVEGEVEVGGVYLRLFIQQPSWV